MSTPRRIAALIADLRLTASSLQQVIDGCQIAGPGAELLQHYPKMLCELATRWERGRFRKRKKSYAKPVAAAVAA